VARAVVGLVLAALIYVSPPPAPRQEPVGLGDLSGRLDVMERKARLLLASNAELQARYRRDVAPIEWALAKRAVDPMLARQAAWAIVREAESRHLDPRLLAAILQVENPWLIPDTVSYAGATGFMQVMPLHVTADNPCGTDLTDGNVSVCYGADILRAYMGRALDDAIRTGLLMYNGCVKTPGCETYADKVLGKVNQ
jgi:hypothetical protein